MAIQGPLFSGFSAPLCCPSARVFLSLFTFKSQLIFSKNRVQFGSPRFEHMTIQMTNLLHHHLTISCFMTIPIIL